ncbi:MAG: hypothetical protein U9N39_07845 [Campylobacterota bacterium]|nr:hypothetical protein [Campylobacterota bacterium]
MTETEKLKLYLEKIEAIALEKIKDENSSAIQALKESLNYVEGEMIGY